MNRWWSLISTDSIVWTTRIFKWVLKQPNSTMTSRLMEEYSIHAQQWLGKRDHRRLHNGLVRWWDPLSTPSAAAVTCPCQSHDAIRRRDTAVPDHRGTWRPALLAVVYLSEKLKQYIAIYSSRRRGVTWSVLFDMEVKRAAALKTDWLICESSELVRATTSDYTTGLDRTTNTAMNTTLHPCFIVILELQLTKLIILKLVGNEETTL